MAGATASPAASAALTVRLFGRFAVGVDGREIAPHEWGSLKAQQLVKLLALAPDQRLSRDQIIDALWPESDPAAVANTFYQTVYYARRTIDPERRGLLSTRQGIVALHHPAGVVVDLHSFQVAAALARRRRTTVDYATALAHYGGELLPDDRYEDWSTAQRDAARQLYLDLLLDLARHHHTQQAWDEAVETLNRVIESDPAHEDAHTMLMQVYVASGRRRSALAQFHQLRAALRELHAAPDPASQQLYATILAGVDSEAHQEAPTATQQHNLPAPLTEIIGREEACAALAAILTGTPAAGTQPLFDGLPSYHTHGEAHPRLLTLIGAGGCGKTRLALAVARRLLDAYPSGVWFVELGGLTEGELVPQVIAQAIGAPTRPVRSPLDTLISHWGDRRALLLLDNCEHLIDACAHVVAALLTGCPNLHVLATSRAPLRVAGEIAWRVPSLELPPPITATSPTAVTTAAMASPAVQLFVSRARQAQSAFAPGAESWATVANICRRLEGLPLALELAAAWVPVLPLDEIAARLDRALLVLSSGNRSAPTRHQTLRAAIDWSHQLLPAAARQLLARLAVFANGWTLAAVEALGDEASQQDSRVERLAIATDEVLPLLAQLVEHSLVAIESGATGLRYRFLEPIRQYAAEQLVAGGEEGYWRERHARHFLAVAEEAEAALHGPTQGRWLARLEQDEENIRAALRWWADQGAAEPGLRLAAALVRFWQTGNRMREGRAWLVEAFAVHQGDAPTAVRAKALNQASFLALYLGDHQDVHAAAAAALALYRDLGDELGQADALIAMGAAAHRQGNLPTAEECYTRALALASAGGNRRQIVRVTSNLAALAFDRHEFTRAAEAYAAILDQARELDDPTLLRIMPLNLALARIEQGETKGVQALLAEALARCVAMRDWTVAAFPVVGLALLANLRGQPERAARLIGASEGIRALGNHPIPAVQVPFTTRVTEEARAALGEAAFALLAEEGRRWTIERVLDAANESW